MVLVMIILIALAIFVIVRTCIVCQRIQASTFVDAVTQVFLIMIT